MKNAKSSTSIRVIYWIARIGYYLGLIVGVILLCILFALLFGVELDNVNFRISLPANIAVVESGVLKVVGESISVRINGMQGYLQFAQFSDVPLIVKVFFLTAAVLIYGALLLVVYRLKLFTRNIYQHYFFSKQNQNSLLYISYILIGLWVVIKIGGTVMFFVLEEAITVKGVELTSPSTGGLTTLFMGLFAYILAKVFAEGRRIEEENRLTV